MCLKELAFIKAPFTNDRLEKFHQEHQECNSGKVTSPRAQNFYASLFTNEYQEQRQERREMTITLEDEERTERQEGEKEVEEEEEGSEGSEEEEEEEEDDEDREQEIAVASITEERLVPSITEEQLAPSLGEDFDWGQVEDWMHKEEEARKSHISAPQQTTVDSVPQQKTTVHKSTPQQDELPSEHPTTAHTLPQQTTSQSIFTPGYSAQTQAIIGLKDSLSREEKCRQENLKEIEKLKTKLRSQERHFERLRNEKLEFEKEREALDRARKVLQEQASTLDRREKAVREIDGKIQKEKKELAREREELKQEREKIEEDKKMMKSESERMTARENDIKINGRKLKALFEEIKKEKVRENEEHKSVIHIPIKDGKIAGDPYIEETRNEKQDCFGHDYVCGHIKIKHTTQLKVSTWNNRTSKRQVTNDGYGSDSSDDFTIPSAKKMKKV